MRLRHYSHKLLLSEIKDTKQDNTRDSFKPRGLWVSVVGEKDWPDWCRAEGFGLDRLTIEHEVVLSNTANILYLSSCQQLDEFTEKYMIPLYPGQEAIRSHGGIDWKRVAGEYDGIIIAPYQWNCRFDLMWYYPWDCQSGCIWNASAIASVKVLEGVTV